METTQEIVLVKDQTNKALQAVESIIVDNDEKMLEAGDIRKRVKIVGKMIKEEKEKATKPLNESLKTIKGWFAPIEADYEKAESIISEKMLSYQKHQEQEAEKIKQQNKEILEDTSNSNSTERYDELKVVPEIIKKSEDFHTRKVRKFRIVDETKIPKEYFIVDEVKIRKAMMADIKIEGVEYYEEKIIV
jgi:hypothetical protein